MDKLITEPKLEGKSGLSPGFLIVKVAFKKPGHFEMTKHRLRFRTSSVHQDTMV